MCVCVCVCVCMCVCVCVCLCVCVCACVCFCVRASFTPDKEDRPDINLNVDRGLLQHVPIGMTQRCLNISLYYDFF